MGKSFFVSGYRDKDPRGGRDLWVDLESQMREGDNDRHPGLDAIATEHRPIMEPEYFTGGDGKPVKNPRYGMQALDRKGRPRTRPVKRDSALGFSSEDFHYAGDRIVTLNEEVEVKGGKPTGRILHHFQRVDDQGRSLGTYEQAWEKEREGRMRSAGRARRYYSM